MGYLREKPDTWKSWWLWLWVVISVVLVTGVPFLSVREWIIAATIGFGGPELFAILNQRDAYPPLTHVIRHFLPKWFAFSLIYGLYGAIAAYWFGFDRPLRFGALFALLGWLTEHFDQVFDERR